MSGFQLPFLFLPTLNQNLLSRVKRNGVCLVQHTPHSQRTPKPSGLEDRGRNSRHWNQGCRLDLTLLQGRKDRCVAWTLLLLWFSTIGFVHASNFICYCGQWGPCASSHIMVSIVQWKPFWHVTQCYTQNDWLGGEFMYILVQWNWFCDWMLVTQLHQVTSENQFLCTRLCTMTYAHRPHCTCDSISMYMSFLDHLLTCH